MENPLDRVSAEDQRINSIKGTVPSTFDALIAGSAIAKSRIAMVPYRSRGDFHPVLKNRFVLLAIALIILAGLLFWARRRAADRGPEIDLVAQFDVAEKRSNLPIPKAFELRDITINGETRKSIFMHPTSRITWRITVPDEGILRTWIALAPDAWNKEGDGVLFRIGVSDGSRYQELAKEHMNPYSQQADRRWRPITIDLSWYGGRQVDLIFNTNSSLPEHGDNPSFDWAYWGAPAIYARE